MFLAKVFLKAVGKSQKSFSQQFPEGESGPINRKQNSKWWASRLFLKNPNIEKHVEDRREREIDTLLSPQ